MLEKLVNLRRQIMKRKTYNNLKAGKLIMDEYFVTVFPKEEGEMPQDFPSYAEAKEFADEEYGEGNYIIESPCY